MFFLRKKAYRFFTTFDFFTCLDVGALFPSGRGAMKKTTTTIVYAQTPGKRLLLHVKCLRAV